MTSQNNELSMKTNTLQRFIFLFLCFVSTSLFADPSYILCIDGGGSKTILHVLDQEGQLVSLVKDNINVEKIEASASNVNNVGKEGVRTVLQTLFENVKIDKDATSLVDILPYCQVVAGMAGVGLSKNKEKVVSLFEEYGIKNESILIMSDAELALHLIDDQGIILISGTGSICLGKKNNALYRVGGLGKVLGDEGSGYQIGLQAIKAVLAEEYGWGSATSLTPKLKEFFNVTELKSLIQQITPGEMSPTKIASCAPLVFKEAYEKDTVAEEIINRAANDLGNIIDTQLKISNLSDCEVHLWGGVFKNSYVDEFMQKVFDAVTLKQDKNLTIINNAHQNAPALYAQKFLLSKQ